MTGRARRGGPRVSDPVLSRCMKSMMYSYRVPSRNAKRVAVVHISSGLKRVQDQSSVVSGKTPPPPTPKLTSEVNRPRRPDLRGQPPDRRLRVDVSHWSDTDTESAGTGPSKFRH